MEKSGHITETLGMIRPVAAVVIGKTQCIVRVEIYDNGNNDVVMGFRETKVING